MAKNMFKYIKDQALLGRNANEVLSKLTQSEVALMTEQFKQLAQEVNIKNFNKLMYLVLNLPDDQEAIAQLLGNMSGEEAVNFKKVMDFLKKEEL